MERATTAIGNIDVPQLRRCSQCGRCPVCTASLSSLQGTFATEISSMVRTAALGSVPYRWNCDSVVAPSQLGIIRYLHCGVLLSGRVGRLARRCATFHAAKTDSPSSATSPHSSPWHWPNSAKETTVIVARSPFHSRSRFAAQSV